MYVRLIFAITFLELRSNMLESNSTYATFFSQEKCVNESFFVLVAKIRDPSEEIWVRSTVPNIFDEQKQKWEEKNRNIFMDASLLL